MGGTRPGGAARPAFGRVRRGGYEVAVDLDAVRHVYALRPLSQSIVSSLNTDVSLDDLAEDIAQIGYAVVDAVLD